MLKFAQFSKLLAALVFLPPMYVLFRYIRWYLKSENSVRQADES